VVIGVSLCRFWAFIAAACEGSFSAAVLKLYAPERGCKLRESARSTAADNGPSRRKSWTELGNIWLTD